ncbi:MAG: PIN domain-containing protein [Deltaproteobacteria bacterium]|nr:PIN domain-containing protein [Deltaproteobacteria bacterium]
MIAVDTNILIYAHREDSEWHKKAYECIVNLAEGSSNWAIPWPCLHEFFSIATHPRIYAPPSSVADAINQIEAWLESPSLVLLAESHDYWSSLHNILNASKVIGPMVHDARIAALCLQHGVKTLLSADRDFSRFASLQIKNPLISE